MRSLAILLALAACGNGGSTPSQEVCTQAVCPLGGHTYKFCSAGGACRYQGSDGKTFACSSCSNCNSASNQIANWCTVGTTTTTSGGTTTSTGGTTTSGPPLNGCSGLVNCYVDCNSSNPVQSCYDDCDAGATQQAQDLITAYGNCIDTNCFQANDADSGMPFCTDATVNSTVCQACYSRILAAGGVCKSAQDACVADKP